MLVSRVNIDDVNDLAAISKTLDVFPSHRIDKANWDETSVPRPKALFKIGHNGTHLFLQYFVEENEILAKTAEDNGAVWTDSCVEFFIRFTNSDYYYNLELSCIGKALFGYRKERKNVVYADSEIMSSIKRYSSLGDKNFDKKQGDFKWNLLVIIPASAYWQSAITSFDGVEAKANFYKCGDNLTIPHYLSWNPICCEKPNFHIPAYFGNIAFE